MPILRRTLLSVVASAPLLPHFASAADARLGPRTFGSPDAKVKVTEFFSLTCTHCAAFSRETMPQVTKELIEPGKLQMIYRDFPLDRLALAAAMVARALPADRYEPFVAALFASQDRWAFNRQAMPIDELQKMALLAGLSRETFDATVNDEAFAKEILADQQASEKEYGINSTPTFVCNGKVRAGEMSFDAFSKFVAEAAG